MSAFRPSFRRAVAAFALPLVALGFVALPASAQLGFQKVTDDPVVTTAGNSLGFAWGDMDGDGDLDLYVANGTGSVAPGVFVNLGGGTFVQQVTGVLANDFGNSSDAAWGDLDGDGDLDLYVARRAGTANALFVNQGGLQGGAQGTFVKQFAGDAVTDTNDSRAVRLADLDGDGDLDIVVANASNQNNAVYINQGGLQGGVQGQFVRLLAGPVGSDGGASLGLDLADIDNDGDLDLYVANSNQANFLYRNGGTANFLKVVGVHPALDVHDSQDTVFADLDGDGDQDLVVANFGVNAIYLNDGGVQGGTPGNFTKVTTGAAVTDSTSSLGLALGDADGDGDVDIFIANCCGVDNILYRNSGAGGQFSAAASGPWVGDGGYGTAAGFVDYDSDGDADLFVANLTSGGSSLNALYRRITPGEFTKLTTGVLATDIARPFDVVPADIDGDGDLDIFSPNSNGDDNSLYVNQGGLQGGSEGSFLSVSSVVTQDGGDSWGADFGDIDGDGDLDLFVANRAGQADFLYLNAGGLQGGTEGQFVRVLSGPVVTNIANGRHAAFRDIDGDGDLDLAVANSENTGNFLYRNLGGAQGGVEGTFEALVSPITTDLGDNYCLAWGDIDGDGDADLFVGNRSGNNALYVNIGGLQGGPQGVFAKLVNGPVVTDGGQTFGARFADMDGDGDEDLVVINGSGVNFLYRNLGGAQGGSIGTFERVLTGPLGTDAAAGRRPAWGDADGDGDLDLFVPNALGVDNSFYRNLGDGQFENYGGVAVGDGGNSRAAVFADLDGDGDLDLLVANHGEAKGVYRNDSPGSSGGSPFQDVGFALPGQTGEPLLNGLGTLQPSTPVAFQIVQARANAPAALLMGLSSLFVPFKGGVLVPAPDLVLPGLVTDSTGFLFIAATWPDGVPSGFQFFVQVWIVDPAGPQGLAATNALHGTTP